MGKTEDLAKLRRILKAFADIIRESDGTTEPIAVSDMRQRIAAATYATFNVDNEGCLRNYTFKNGTNDPSVPENTLEYYTKLITNFADKVRVGSEELDIDDIDNEKYSICGINIVNNKYTLRLPDNVTHIPENLFFYNEKILKVILPNTFTTFDQKSFQYCTYLTDINIPNGVTSIPYGCFSGCSNLTNVSLPENLTEIGDSAFSSCKSFTELYIPNTVTTIGSNAFGGCSNLVTCHLSENLTSIPSNCFYMCSKLKNINFPNSLTSIGQLAFVSCISLTDVTISNNVTKINESAFSSCTNLTNVSLNENLTEIGHRAFSDCTNLSNVNIPSTVTRISGGAFRGCRNLTQITLPENLTNIGDEAFNYTGITEMNIPENLYIQSFVGNFCGNSPVETLTVDENNQTCYSENNCVIDTQTKTLIMGCKTSILPNDVTSIGEKAFYSSPISTINLENISTIGHQAFAKSSLESVTLSSSLTSIGISAFEESSIESLDLSDCRITIIPSSMCTNCHNLNYVRLPNTVARIEAYAFQNCDSLSSFIFSESQSLTYIGFSAFNSANLGDVVLPYGLQTIDDSAFADSSLNQIEIPYSVQYIGSSAFENTYASVSIHYNGYFNDLKQNKEYLERVVRSFYNSGYSNITFIWVDESSDSVSLTELLPDDSSSSSSNNNGDDYDYE